MSRYLPLVLFFVAFAVSARAEPSGGWVVVGLRQARVERIGIPVEELRGALGEELGEEEIVLDAQQVRGRLGLPPVAGESAEALIEAAEIHYFQFESKEAREQLEGALAQLAHRNDAKAAERLRAARLLLGAVHLAEGGTDSSQLARSALEPITRLSPEFEPDPRAYPRELVALYGELRREREEEEKGALVVRCEGDCAEAGVWSEGHRLGDVGERIVLAPGGYRLIVADRLGRQLERSLLHEVEVQARQVRELEVELGWESAALAEDGPSLLVRDDAERERVVAALRSRLEPGATLVVLLRQGALLRAERFEGEAGGPSRRGEASEGAVLAPSRIAEALVGAPSELVAVVAVGAASGGEAGASVGAEMLASGEEGESDRRGGAPGEHPASSGDEDDEEDEDAESEEDEDEATDSDDERADAHERERERLAAMLLEDEPSEPASWIPPTRWAMAGAAVIAGAAGIWLRADASGRYDRLEAWRRSSGGTVSSIEEGRAVSRQLGEIRSQSDWGTALLVGAGGAAVTSLVLWLYE